MVEFVLGKNIKTKCDKVIIGGKVSEIVSELSSFEAFLIPCVKKQKAEDKIVEYNLGEYKIFTLITPQNQTSLQWRKVGAYCYQKIKNCREVKIKLLNKDEKAAYDFVFGMEMESYRFDKYFTKKDIKFYPKLEKIIFVGLKDFAKYKDLAALANCVRYARDLINEPANCLTPEIMASDIRRLEYLGLEVEILDEIQLKEQGFGLALAVGQGSANRPRIAVIKWKGNKKEKNFSIGLVGKGVTFDSGGISLKSAANMGDMKQDMAGAAVMVATMKSLALQRVEKNVVAVVGLVENLPSATAYRPGDVVVSMSGQTVEVVNTDAEGRLVLADCLTYIQKEYKPKYVLDMATLTGAIVVALGHSYAGLFANNSKLAQKIIASGAMCGERLWQMPMDEEYDKLIDSTIADMKNTGGRSAGSATAACFLQRFIDKNTQWAHIDIAGMDLVETPKPMYPKGASGFGVVLLNNFIRNL